VYHPVGLTYTTSYRLAAGDGSPTAVAFNVCCIAQITFANRNSELISSINPATASGIVDECQTPLVEQMAFSLCC
jgi:hypothetical protein